MKNSKSRWLLPDFTKRWGRMLLVLLFAVSVTGVFAQSKSISGVVLDVTGEPVIGASVIIDGTTNGTITDFDGNFTLGSVPEGALLKISYIGYLSQQVRVGSDTTYNITLDEDRQTLDEVVVIGYGTVKKSTLTSAVSKMDSKGIENRPLARAENALQGQLAGVSVRTTTGEPGADIQVRVRGAASVNASSDPLYIVDGVPITTLSGINPSDIESIEVLKDAASAAIYGSRGSNGVVMVTTKKGKSGKPTVALNVSFGVQQMEKKLDLLNSSEWMETYIKYTDAMYLSEAKNQGITDAKVSDSNAVRLANLGVGAGTTDAKKYAFDERWFKYVGQDVRNTHTFYDDPEELSLLDWQDEFYRNGLVQDYSVNISGGNDNTSYMFSGGYMNQEGIATGTGYQRYTFRTNIESKLSKYVTAGIFLAPTYIKIDGSGLANGKDTQAHTVLALAPVSEPGVGYMVNSEPNEQYFWGGSPTSPVNYMNTNIREDEIVRFTGNAFVRVKPLEGLNVELSASTNFYDKSRAQYFYTSATNNWTGGEGSTSSGGHYTERMWNTLLQAVVNYDRTFKNHGLNVMVGASSEQGNVGINTEQTYSAPFANDAIVYSFNGKQVTPNANIVKQLTPNKLLSAFGRVQYNYLEKYLLSASMRYDGGSIFGANNKWGVFPAVSAGWLVTSEEFMKSLDLTWLNTFKIRASYGVTGNNSISNTAAYAALTAVNYGGLAGYNASSLGNPDLGWEKTHSTDIAFDLGLFNNRIQFSFDWYTKTTKDLLYQVPTLGASGFSTVWDNLGQIDNKGFEIELNTRNIISKDFTWTSSLNLSYNKNKVISLGKDDTPVYSGFDSTNHSNVLMVGKSINTFYMYEAIGVWQTQAEIDAFSAAHGGQAVTFNGSQIKPGDIRYRDVNGDGVFTEEDKDYLGSPTPKFVYGMTHNFTYKNFDLSVLITAQTGGKIYGVLGRAIDRPGMGALTNMMGHWRDAWWSEEDPGNGSVPYLLSATTGTTLDSRWLYSSDYLRIKNLTIGYKIPVNPKFLSYARVYFSVENLAKWDNYYGGYSPEAANTAASTSPGGSAALGLDYGSYPVPRIYTLGVNITF